jgi:hypothetical protein
MKKDINSLLDASRLNRNASREQGCITWRGGTHNNHAINFIRRDIMSDVSSVCTYRYVLVAGVFLDFSSIKKSINFHSESVLARICCSRVGVIN